MRHHRFGSNRNSNSSPPPDQRCAAPCPPTPPAAANRCLVADGDMEAPSFLLESVTNGDQQGRYSFLGAMPALEVVAKGHKV